jgi:phthalate 4,5-cis-dihydrodiol dehydrogenase
VTGVNSGSLEAATAFAARYGGKAHRTAGELLAAPDVDAVLIATPHEWHAPLALQTIASSKPLLLEKPVATNSRESHAVLDAARTAGVPCLVGFTSHYFPGFSRARALIDGGELGRPLSGQSVFQKRWMEANRRDWHLDRARGGGMLLTAGIHALDRLMWLMDAPVQTVSAVIGTHR